MDDITHMLGNLADFIEPPRDFDRWTRTSLRTYLVGRGLNPASRLGKGELTTLAEGERRIHVEQYAQALQRVAHWALSSPAPERDIPIPEQGYTRGWDHNPYNHNVYKAWSGVVRHGNGHDVQRSASQRGRALYSTRALATTAMVHAKSNYEFGKLARLIAGLDDQ